MVTIHKPSEYPDELQVSQLQYLVDYDNEIIKLLRTEDGIQITLGNEDSLVLFQAFAAILKFTKRHLDEV